MAITQLAYGDANATPLVLLHDGGGTVLSYQALGPLDRDVYGISDPRFDAGKPWSGGIPEMARAYLQMIKAAIPQRNILLGGMCALGIRSGPLVVVEKRWLIWLSERPQRWLTRRRLVLWWFPVP